MSTIIGTAGNDTLNGSTGDDVIYGLDGDDTLNGGAGADTMIGGLGNDIYYVDQSGDVVTENADEGIDTVIVSQGGISYTLGANLENLTLTGYGVTGIGNELDNILTVSSGSTTGDILDGGLGADTMAGGQGGDTYYVDNVGDMVIENAGNGYDTVISSISYVLGANVENLTLSGTANLNGTGNELDNILTGNSGDNVLDGGAGDDTLSGGIGQDVLLGGEGDDKYYVDDSGAVVIENAGEGTDTVISSINYTLGDNVENLTLMGSAAIYGAGNDLDNIIHSDDKTVTAANTLAGGLGNDTYYVNEGDIVIENAGEGVDTVHLAANMNFTGVMYDYMSYTLGANVENLSFGTYLVNGFALRAYGVGNELDNIMTVYDSVLGPTGDTLDGGAGADTMSAGIGSDTYYVDNVGDVVIEYEGEGTDTVISSIDYTLVGTYLENLTLSGTAAITGTGNDLANTLTGNISGADTLIGGLGDDAYFVQNTGTMVIENAGEGTETVTSSVDYSLSANVENLKLTSDATIGTGNDLDNTLTSSSWYSTYSSGDTLAGGLGNDTYYIQSVNDVVVEYAGEGIDTISVDAPSYILSANVENLIVHFKTAGVTAIGNELDNVIKANGGTGTGYTKSDTIDGGAGADTMSAGLGGDTYYVDNVGDVVIENAGEGTDTVISSIGYTLTDNVENLTLTGTDAINGAGNTLNNVLTGNSAINTLTGGLGDDTYVVQNTGDVVVENAGEGMDTVQSSVSFTLSANVENLTLTGTDAINGTGNGLDNVIKGNSGINTLTGGLGNDTYYVQNTDDVVIENAGEGTDIVVSTALSYTLSDNVENLSLSGASGSTSVSGTGNALDNLISGNSLANVLDGGAGADTMSGGRGSDTYYVDNAGDVVIENAGTGTGTADGVYSSVSYTLSDNVENLTLTGTDAIDGTGNTSNNVLTGNSAANTLDGGTGADTMAGGLGDDTYVVDNVSDVVTEAASAGTDTVMSTIAYTLGSNVENLTLTNTTAINGTGNTLDNVLYGNSAANTLTAGSGNDLLNGGAGNDVLNGDAGNDVLEGADGNDTLSDTAGNNLFNGGAGTDAMTGNTGSELFIGGTGNDTVTTGTGADIIAFNTGDGQDTVVASTGQDNTLALGGGIEYQNLTMSKTGNDLILNTGSSDQIILQDWYSGTGNHSIANLQLVLDAASYNAGSTDPLLNQQVQDFDFAALAQAFDQALAANPTLTAWSLTDSLLSAHLSGSDTAALGGDLAYQYNLNGTLAGIGLGSAQTVINDANFGVSAQQLHPLAELQTGAVRLS